MAVGVHGASLSTLGLTLATRQRPCLPRRTSRTRCKVRPSKLPYVWLSQHACPTVDDVDSLTGVGNHSAGIESRKRKASSPIVINLISDDDDDEVPTPPSAQAPASAQAPVVVIGTGTKRLIRPSNSCVNNRCPTGSRTHRATSCRGASAYTACSAFANHSTTCCCCCS